LPPVSSSTPTHPPTYPHRRRRPFLVKGLEATLNKFILSLEFYDEEGRKKIAISAYHTPAARQCSGGRAPALQQPQ